MYGILIEANINNKLVRIDIEDVLLYEMSRMDIFQYNIEVVKALAVLKRSELSKRIKNSSYYNPGAKEIIIDEECFNSLDENKKNIIKGAVDETTGIIAASGDKTVDMYFTKCCAGGTANSEDILGYKINYLRKVLCRHCNEGYNEKIVKINDIAKKLNIAKPSYKKSMDNILKDVIRDETGRIIKVNFLGREMSGEDFIKHFDIKSNRVYFSEDSIALKVIGEGVGLGICLEGADKLALEGLGFEEIIKYYYTGVEFKNLDRDSISKLLSGKKIVIDPGHGGRDNGNVNARVLEKNVNLLIALRLEKMLKRKGAAVVVTREDDEDISLEERINIINSERPDFCISIHQNSFIMPGINGVEVYCYDKDEEAIKLGKLLCANISSKVGIKNRGVRIGDYFLLRESKVSTLILECMYMSGNFDMNKYDEENYQLISECIFESICKYYNIEPRN